jgi:hypothetical protein
MDGGAQVLAVACVAGVGFIVAAALKAPAIGITVSLGFLSLVDAQAVAQTIVTFGALAALIYSVGRTRFARTFWRRNVAEPAHRWMRHVLREHTEEVVKPMIDPIIDRLDALEAQPGD